MHVGALWSEDTVDPASAQATQSNASGKDQAQAALQAAPAGQAVRRTPETEKDSADAAVHSEPGQEDDAGSNGPSRLRLALSPTSRMYLNYLEEARRERMTWIAAVPVQAAPAVIGFDGKVDTSYVSSDSDDSDFEGEGGDIENVPEHLGDEDEWKTRHGRSRNASLSPTTAIDGENATVLGETRMGDFKVSKFDDTMVHLDETVLPAKILEEWRRKRDKFYREYCQTQRNVPSDRVRSGDGEVTQSTAPTPRANIALGRQARTSDDDDSFASSCDLDSQLHFRDATAQNVDPQPSLDEFLANPSISEPIHLQNLDSVQEITRYLESCVNDKAYEFIQDEKVKAQELEKESSSIDADLSNPFAVFLCILRHPAATKIARTLHSRIEHLRLAGWQQSTHEEILASIDDITRTVLTLQRKHRLVHTPFRQTKSRWASSPSHALSSSDISSNTVATISLAEDISLQANAWSLGPRKPSGRAKGKTRRGSNASISSIGSEGVRQAYGRSRSSSRSSRCKSPSRGVSQDHGDAGGVGLPLLKPREVHDCVERFYMSRVYNQVFRVDPEICAKDDVLARSIQKHRWVELRHLGVDGPLQKMLPWLDRAGDHLKSINSYLAPKHKLYCIHNCCRLVNRALQEEPDEAGGSGSAAGADEFLPMLIFAVMRADPQYLVSNLSYITEFQNRSHMKGEMSYFLMSCNGAVQFLLSMDERALTLGPDENYEKLVEQHTQSEDVP
eukprot:INCI2293.1.p1 GENE.INCI2293.1~~INCI2293.1.p1  ORF type:complete len:732 (-),score=115.93 INCI2293.1:1283-3478(-)